MSTLILQARIGSTRLPGKALREILGKPMLFYTVESLKQAPAVDKVILAIPTLKRDDVLVKLAEEWEIECFRGSEDNVLERFFQAAQKYPDDFYFRATGDNPVIDLNNPQRILAHLKKNSLDYCCEKNTPIGSDVEVLTYNALEKSYRNGKSLLDTEHVTWFMKKSGLFKIDFIDPPYGTQFKDVRLTVDYPEDFIRVKKIIETLYKKGIPEFRHVLNYLQKEGKNG